MSGKEELRVLAHCSRQAWDTATFKVNAELISQLWDIFLSEVDLIKTIPGTLAGLNLQLLTKDEIQIFSANGGNSLGINKEDGPLFRTRGIPRANLYPDANLFICG
jgi:hypothetical protein